MDFCPTPTYFFPHTHTHTHTPGCKDLFVGGLHNRSADERSGKDDETTELRRLIIFLHTRAQIRLRTRTAEPPLFIETASLTSEHTFYILSSCFLGYNAHILTHIRRDRERPLVCCCARMDFSTPHSPQCNSSQA